MALQSGRRLEIQICNLAHTYSEQSLELFSSCSIRLFFPHTYKHIETIETNTELLTYQQIWVDRGQGLRLSINNVIDDIPWSESERKSLLDELAIRLVESEVQWCHW